MISSQNSFRTLGCNLSGSGDMNSFRGIKCSCKCLMISYLSLLLTNSVLSFPIYRQVSWQFWGESFWGHFSLGDSWDSIFTASPSIKYPSWRNIYQNESFFCFFFLGSSKQTHKTVRESKDVNYNSSYHSSKNQIRQSITKWG